MYRKYTSSGKSSRNERLAQLSEQESVIERKKKEILAKLEAQKKKESEEALKKLEPQSSFKKDNSDIFKKHNWSSREKDSEEKTSLKCPRNAFSNDGSFLDQFKKMSGSGLSSKSAVYAPKKEEESSVNKECKDVVNESDSGSNSKAQDSHMQSLSGEIPLDLQHSPKFNIGSFSDNSTENDVQLNAISSYPITEISQTVPYQSNFKSDNVSKNFPYPTDPPSSTQFQKTASTMPVCNSLSTTLCKTESSFETDISRRISSALPHEGAIRNQGYRSAESAIGRNVDTHSDTQSGDKRLASDSDNSSEGIALQNARIESENYSKSTAESDSEHRPAKKRRNKCSDDESYDSDPNSKDLVNQKTSNSKTKGGYKADCEDESDGPKISEERQKKFSFHRTSTETSDKSKENERETVDDSATGEKRKRKKKSRWGDEVVPAGTNSGLQLPENVLPLTGALGGKTPMLSQVTRSDPGLIQYARQTFGSTNLSEEDWKKAEDHYKINLLYQDMLKKRAEIDRLEKAGKFKYEYDSDEDVEGGTWEHKLRQQEMMATQLWAEELTRQAAGKHHIGDFLPPEELERFMEKYNAVKQGRTPDLSDYKEFKLKEDNVGYRLLQKMGWSEGQGLGQDGTGITNPVNKATTRHENQGLGVDRPDGLQAGDDEYDAYRKRMMLAYRFRPNPLNNPRRPYY